MNNEIATYQEKISDILNEISASIDSYSREVNNSKWGTDISEIFNNYRNLESELSNTEFEQIKNLSNLYSQLDEKHRLLDRINAHKEIVQKNNDEIEKELKVIQKLYSQICNCRRNFVSENFQGIKISVIEKSDFENYVKKLRSLLGKELVYDDQFTKLKELLETREITINDIYNSIAGAKDKNKSDIFTNTKLYNTFSQISPETLLRVRLLTPDDKIVITLEINGRKVELTNASAGQKTSAMLTMILALGNNALVIDQPEDDLDSQLINSLIVNNMILKKHTRQIVVVTHNANIPVNGDSEWVIAMGDTKELSTEVSETIDSDTIKGKVCSVMEGGTEAFNNRAVRYGFRK